MLQLVPRVLKLFQHVWLPVTGEVEENRWMHVGRDGEGRDAHGRRTGKKRHNVGKKEQGQEIHKRNEEKHREDI